MSNFNKLSKEIPDTKMVFTIQVTGQFTKKDFVGEFECHIPNRKEQCLIDKHRASLNGPNSDQLGPETLKFHHMISYLRYTLNVKECPRWWKESDLGYEMYDENVVEAIYDKVLEHEVQWMRAVWGDEHVDQLLGKGKQDVGEEAGKQKGA